MSEDAKIPEFDETLLDILRCPVAVHELVDEMTLLTFSL